MDSRPPRPIVDAIWMPIGQMNDEQLVKFLERNRRRHLLYERPQMGLGIEAAGIAKDEHDTLTLETTPRLVVQRTDLVVNRHDVIVPMTALRSWLGPHLRRILVKLKKNPKRFKSRTLVPWLVYAEVLPKHPEERDDPKLRFSVSAHDFSA